MSISKQRSCKCKCNSIITSKDPKVVYISGHNTKETNKAVLANRLIRWQNIINEILKNKEKCYDINYSKVGAHFLVKRLWSTYYNKKWPKKMLACHTCDNPSCLNIFHIYPGTHKSNAQDMISRDRANKSKGEEHYNAKLTEDEVLQIRSLYASGKYDYHELAKMFKVHASTIKAIILRHNWKHI